MKRLIYTGLLAIMASPAFSQETNLSITLAEKAYDNQEYGQAAHLFEKVERYHSLHFYKVPPDVPGKLATCYRELNDYPDAARWYKKITDQPAPSPEDWIGYGDVLKSMGRYDEAKAAYNHVPDSLRTHITDRIAGCDSALIWISHPTIYTVSDFASINTAESDWGAVAYGPHSVVFTSDSNRTPAIKAYQKVYVLNGDSISSFSPIMNDNLYHDGAVTFSPDGDTAYFSVTNPGTLRKSGDKLKYQDHGRTVTVRLRRLELWWTAKDSSGHWGSSQPFPYNNPEKYSLGQATLDPSGRILYFASDMPGGYGKTDIWYSERQPDGSWGKPVNCGPQVNTADEEAFPYVGADGVLYFASKGHAGMGGFDVYAATGADSAWTSVANLKYPINSAGDDFFYTIKDSLSGYVSSDRPGGKGGDDIYTYSRPATKPPVVIATPADTAKNLAAAPNSGLNSGLNGGAPGGGLNGGVPGNPGTTPDSTVSNGATPNATAVVPAPKRIILKTQVLDKLTRKSLSGAQVTVAKESGETLTPVATPAAGLTLYILDPNTHFLDSAIKDGYIADGASVSTDGVTAPDTLNVKLYLLKQPEKGDVFVLHNVYFDLNKWNIRSDAAEELDRLVAYMKQYPTVKIDLSAHTDSRGEDDFNMRLSIKRARSARWYLHQHGIAWERITYHGYGETRLVNGCSNNVPCTEEEHQANRRVEVKILHQ